ncbi:hypothetical protein SAMN02799630_00704 [Paenibacillus sp. UNCCL117]|uniref:hypothetical protein n=1 Tax=unclassified Paenibacillus TaxID=185978 RepID=UPI0008901B98|nr:MULTISPECIES: hypothetical protein [unclassified Paenibacillus]SDC16823.1 hypothetical protein SAMN04488602_101503 [Paenibacillus sp. cl123]SFW17880.1 hypothetical protein SAMN02799630_00704 [Paenibacillus sp. UNCCL117]
MKLYNNIELPEEWPPNYKETTLDKPLPSDYKAYWPETVNISIGRQLFVDEFVVEDTNLTTKYHQPVLMDQPVFEPETPLELNDGYCTCACPFNDGIFYDDTDKKFKMWYQAGWFDGVGCAESEDGIHWKRLSELFPDRQDDRVIPYEAGALRDGSAVWIDYEAADISEKYKMLVFFRKYDFEVKYYHRMPKHFHDIPGSVPPLETIKLYKSANGIDWTEIGETTLAGDNSTFFHNPFTKKWAFSLRTFSTLDSRVRTRGYIETEDFFKGSKWKSEDVRFWSRTDIYDSPDPKLGFYTQLYNLDATPYESIMLGVFSVFMGPPNPICELTKMPKVNDLKLAYSRDGFHWDRPTHDNFISSSREAGRWDYGYAHSPNGVCLVVGDELFFYVSFFSGQSPNFGTHEYSGGSLGLAKLRRDGFASLTDEGKGGYVVTKKLEFNGNYLFVNVDSSEGAIYAEILDEESNVIPGFSKSECIPVAADSTKIQIRWNNRQLEELDLKVIRIRFHLENSHLYSFWISEDPEGHSKGYMAAGGPFFHHGIDRKVD